MIKRTDAWNNNVLWTKMFALSDSDTKFIKKHECLWVETIIQNIRVCELDTKFI